ncbi:MAG: lactonase family protein [Thermomicrobiales bacterium]
MPHRFMRLVARVGAVALVLIGLALPFSHASAQTPQVEIAGQVYVNLNTARANTIAAFDRHADGTLTPLPGSPFATGGVGTGMILGSQGALQVTSDGRYLLAVDAGSNQLSVLSIAEGGELSPVDGGTVDSGGLVPLSIAVHEDLIYVANAGDGTNGSNYTGFRLSQEGVLSPVEGSTVTISATALPGHILFNATGTLLAAAEVGPDAGPSYIDSFSVNNDGTLTAAAGSPFPAQALGPFGSVFSPVDPSQLYVSNAHAGPNLGSVSAYTVASDGTLSPNSGSPYPNQQTAPCWVEISPDGQYVFSVNTGVPSISSYHVEEDGSLALVGNTVFNQPSGLRPFDARIDPAGTYLYVVDAGAAKVSVFAVDGGNLTELPASPVSLPAGATPFGLVVI